MTQGLSAEQNLHKIIENARYAPSVHNTQPWKVSAEGDTIHVAIDPRHKLVAGDPTGRETIISMGIFAEAIIIGALAEGLEINIVKLSGTSVSLTFTPAKEVPEDATELTALLRRRATDRSVYKPAEIGQAAIDRLLQTPQTNHTQMHVVTDRTIIENIADLTSHGISLSLSSPTFRQELSQYLVLPMSRKKRGIAVRSLRIPAYLTWVEPWLVRFGLGMGAEARHEKRRWQSSSAVVVITSDGDLAQHWLDTGRTYLRASLAIEAPAFSQATYPAGADASNKPE
jgi:hypothetical protein